MKNFMKLWKKVTNRGRVFFYTSSDGTGAQPEIFQGGGGFAELGHFIKNFVKNTRQKAPQGKLWSLNIQGTPKTTFWMEYLTQK